MFLFLDSSWGLFDPALGCLICSHLLTAPSPIVFEKGPTATGSPLRPRFLSSYFMLLLYRLILCAIYGSKIQGCTTNTCRLSPARKRLHDDDGRGVTTFYHFDTERACSQSSLFVYFDLYNHRSFSPRGARNLKLESHLLSSLLSFAWRSKHAQRPKSILAITEATKMVHLTPSQPLVLQATSCAWMAFSGSQGPYWTWPRWLLALLTGQLSSSHVVIRHLSLGRHFREKSRRGIEKRVFEYKR